MSLPILPPAPENPPIVAPGPTAPTSTQFSTPGQVPQAPGYPQGSAANLSGTQTNANNALNTTNIRNSATYINEIRGSRVQVGDISYDVPSLGFTASANQYGDYQFNAQISIPLGGSHVRRSGKAIANIRAQAALGALCKSIQQANFDVEIVTALYPNAPQLTKCVAKAVQEVKESQPDLHSEALKAKVAQQDAELGQLRAEIELMRLKFKQGQQQHQNQQNAVRGLW